jgi:sec-independent protein translocase protein TatC
MATNELEEQDRLASMYGSDTVEDDDDDEEEDLTTSTLEEHLEDLRRRIFISLIAVAVGSIIAFVFRIQILYVLELPLPKIAADSLTHGKLVVSGITEGFTVYLMISVAAGFILALPVVLYQIWAFIRPAMFAKEKKYAKPFVFAGVILFAGGVTVGYFVLQYPVQWLITFASDSFAALITAGSYFTFVAFFLLAFGIVFEIPLVLTFLALVDLITAQTLIKKRTVAHISMWIAATFLTPGADLYSPIFLGISMSFLYELSIIFIKITMKQRQ